MKTKYQVRGARGQVTNVTSDECRVSRKAQATTAFSRHPSLVTRHT